MKIVMTISLVLLGYFAFAQTKDTLLFKISKLPYNEPEYHLYRVLIYNASDSPVCILHSSYINLFYNSTHKLALLNKNVVKEVYTLAYTARDTLNDYELTNDNYNGEIVLPRQQVEFKLLIPVTINKEKYIQFECLYLTNLCYKEFTQAIFEYPNSWYRNYQKFKKKFLLPK